jgi:hypothetical protein
MDKPNPKIKLDTTLAQVLMEQRKNIERGKIALETMENIEVTQITNVAVLSGFPPGSFSGWHLESTAGGSYLVVTPAEEQKG